MLGCMSSSATSGPCACLFVTLGIVFQGLCLALMDQDIFSSFDRCSQDFGSQRNIVKCAINGNIWHNNLLASLQTLSGPSRRDSRAPKGPIMHGQYLSTKSLDANAISRVRPKSNPLFETCDEDLEIIHFGRNFSWSGLWTSMASAESRWPHLQAHFVYVFLFRANLQGHCQNLLTISTGQTCHCDSWGGVPTCPGD